MSQNLLDLFGVTKDDSLTSAGTKIRGGLEVALGQKSADHILGEKTGSSQIPFSREMPDVQFRLVIIYLLLIAFVVYCVFRG
jgi:hypothetical protein